MSNDFIENYQEAYQEKTPFAMAMVVNRTVPSSGKPGDKAIIFQDGTMKGWIGGGCTRGIVLKEALLSIQQGKPRLVAIRPGSNEVTELGVVSYQMTCQSGGSVYIYIEPVLPKPHILILGKSHIAMALSRIGKATGYQVSVVSRGADKIMFPEADRVLDQEKPDPSLITPNTYIVVCTQGDQDEQALRYGIESGSGYVSFVSSLKKANSIYSSLRKQGVGMDDLKRVKTPAGININAKLPEEVAISILAEIISLMRDTKKSEGEVKLNMENLFINPVCNIPVEKSTAKHVIHYKDIPYYFCCDGCKVTFEADPEKYALKETAASGT